MKLRTTITLVAIQIWLTKDDHQNLESKLEVHWIAHLNKSLSCNGKCRNIQYGKYLVGISPPPPLGHELRSIHVTTFMATQKWYYTSILHKSLDYYAGFHSHLHYVHIHPKGQISFHGGRSEWFFFNAKWAIFQIYHGENKFQFEEMMMSTLY
jgi:hypothetical protein